MDRILTTLLGSRVPTTSTLVHLALLTALLYAIFLRALPRPIPGIPYNKQAVKSIFGDVPAAFAWRRKQKTPFEWMALQCEALKSPIVQLFVRPFQKPWIVLVEPRETEDLLMRRSAEFDRSSVYSDYFAGTTPNHSIGMPTGPEYKAQSRLLAETMQPGFLRSVAAPHLWHSAEQLVKCWKLKAQLAHDHPFSAVEDLENSAMSSIWLCAFDSDLKALSTDIELLEKITHVPLPGDIHEPVNIPHAVRSSEHHAACSLTGSLEVISSSPLPRLAHWLHRQRASWKQAKSIKDRMVLEAVQAAESRLDKNEFGEHTRCATDIMLQQELKTASKQGRPPKFYTVNLSDELFGFVVAGSDTTSTALSWAVKHLADNPSIQSRLRESLNVALHRDISLENLQAAHIPYLDAFIEESLRCGRLAASLMRTTTRDVTLLGHTVPKGYHILMVQSEYGYIKPEFWSPVDEGIRSQTSRDNKAKFKPWDPQNIGVFRPERWLKTDDNGKMEYDGHAGPSYQFGLGIRGCFGKKLAYLEMRIVLALLVWNFEFLDCGPTCGGNVPVQRFLLKPQTCYVRLRRISGGNAVREVNV